MPLYATFAQTSLKRGGLYAPSRPKVVKAAAPGQRGEGEISNSSVWLKFRHHTFLSDVGHRVVARGLPDKGRTDNNCRADGRAQIGFHSPLSACASGGALSQASVLAGPRPAGVGESTVEESHWHLCSDLALGACCGVTDAAPPSEVNGGGRWARLLRGGACGRGLAVNTRASAGTRHGFADA